MTQGNWVRGGGASQDRKGLSIPRKLCHLSYSTESKEGAAIE